METDQWKRQQNQEIKGLAETFLLFVKVNFESMKVFFSAVIIGYKVKKVYWVRRFGFQNLNDLGFRPTTIATYAYMVRHH